MQCLGSPSVGEIKHMHEADPLNLLDLHAHPTRFDIWMFRLVKIVPQAFWHFTCLGIFHIHVVDMLGCGLCLAFSVSDGTTPPLARIIASLPKEDMAWPRGRKRLLDASIDLYVLVPG